MARLRWWRPRLRVARPAAAAVESAEPVVSGVTAAALCAAAGVALEATGATAGSGAGAGAGPLPAVSAERVARSSAGVRHLPSR